MQISEKSVMIVATDMIPYTISWGGCQRMYFLADYLQEHGFNVHVVHAKKSEIYDDYGHKIRFHSIPIPVYSIGSSAGQNLSDTDRIGGRFKKGLINFIKFFIKKTNILSFERIVFNEPILGLGVYGLEFSWNARNTIIKTISEHNIKNIIISAPPFSVLCLAPLIKKQFPKVNIILDYRDPWNTPLLSYRISSFIEQRILKSADKIVFLNDRMFCDTLKKYSLPKKKCLVVLNGYSDRDWEDTLRDFKDHDHCKNAPEKMIISYVGSLSFNKGGYRDVTSLLDAFMIFHKNKNVLLRFVGIISSDAVERIKKQFPDNIEILPPVDTKTAFHYMIKSDVLFLLHTNEKTGRYMLSGKFFDYIRSGKVILGIASTRDTYFLEFIQKYHLGVTCLSEILEIIKCLELLYEKWMNEALEELRPDEGLDIKTFSRDVQNCKYLTLLEELLQRS